MAAIEPDAVHVYEPMRQWSLGLRAYPKMARDLWRARDLFFQFVRRDILLRARTSFFGVLWSAAHPLGLLITFVLLRRAGIVNPHAGGVEYAAFAGLGVIHWSLFSGLLTQAAGSLVGASNLIVRARFPSEVLVLAACMRVLVDWLFGLVILATLFVWLGVTPAWTVVLAPLSLLPLIFLGVGLGLLLALGALPLRDVLHALPLVLTPLLFLSPVFYELPSGGVWEWVRIFNPISVSFEALRGLTFAGTLPDPALFGFWLAASVFVCLGSWRVFNLVIPKIPEYAS